jgi:hypothetical protein
MKTLLESLIRKDEELGTMRRPWEAQWQEIKDLVYTSAGDFNRVTTPGNRTQDLILDGTAPWALEQLSAGLHSFLTSPQDRWFNLCIQGEEYRNDPQALLWLEMVSDMIYKNYSSPKSNNDNSLHETYMNLGAFGTAVEYQDIDMKEKRAIFRSIQLRDCRILENSKGVIDTLFRDVMMTTRQILQEFPDTDSKKIKEEKNQNKEWLVVHGVFPRTDRDTTMMNAKNKPFASFWFCKAADTIFKESGYDEFPFSCPRWVKRSGEVYGRSPGMTCLPDIKMVNAMEKVQLKAIQKIVDPPLLVPDDGFMLPIATSPSSLIFFEAGLPGEQMIKPLETKGRVEVGEDKLEQKRSHILRCFYADWVSRIKKKERQTATEIQDDREEMMQMMSPILGRLQSELLGPRLARTYNILSRLNLIPPAPRSLEGRKLVIEYISPAAKAQMARKSINMRRYLEELIPLVQVDPTILDTIDTDAYAREMASLQDVSRLIFRTPEEVSAIREKRNQAQEAQQMAATAQPAASAMKDIATAQEKGLSLGSL